MSEPILPKIRLIPRTRRVERQHAEEAIAHLRRTGFAKIQLLATRDGWDYPECIVPDGNVFDVGSHPGCLRFVVAASPSAAGWSWWPGTKARRLPGAKIQEIWALGAL